MGKHFLSKFCRQSKVTHLSLWGLESTLSHVKYLILFGYISLDLLSINVFLSQFLLLIFMLFCVPCKYHASMYEQKYIYIGRINAELNEGPSIL